MRPSPKHYETDKTLPQGAVRVRGFEVACRVLGWQTEPDEDTEWSGYETRTGRIIVRMIGDDHRYAVDPDDIAPIAREEYCSECGQIGCGHDGEEHS